MILQRHFVFKHPLFRKAKTSTGVEWRKSIYYLRCSVWRGHDGYRRNLRDRRQRALNETDKDFDNVHADDFKEWGTKYDRGARLFWGAGDSALRSCVCRGRPTAYCRNCNGMGRCIAAPGSTLGSGTFPNLCWTRQKSPKKARLQLKAGFLSAAILLSQQS